MRTVFPVAFRSRASSARSRASHRLSQGGAMNKSDMIEQIARSADISKAAAERALDAAVASIKAALRKGTPVTLVGFGTFYVGKRAARTGRDPRTQAEIRITAARVPKFRPGKALKDALN
ncbi:MAG: HU family DNA-binding protein [Burkholderiales bacterium]